jgi:hypothetical protein
MNADRLNSIDVRIGNTYPVREGLAGLVGQANERCAYVPGALPAGATRLECPRPIVGRFVTIQITGKNGILTLCEVQFHLS